MPPQDNGGKDVRQALESAASHWLNLVEFGILKTFIDFKIFDLIPEEGDIAISVLAEKCNGQEALVDRFSDYLIKAGILSSPKPGNVSHTPRSRAYRTSELAAGFVSHVYHFFLRPMAFWSTYFEKNGLAEPSDARITPLGLGTGHGNLDLYGILDVEPKLAELFNSAQARSAGIYSLKGVYDLGWTRETLAVSRDNRPAIVDVGGSHGLALRDILVDYDFIPPARCVVFDRPQTIEEAKRKMSDELLCSVDMVGGNMLEPFPQSIRGALVYQYRRVLSDFVDKDIVMALELARESCAPDSRLLLIEELVKADRSQFSIAQDISVLNFGGKRRSESMFRELAAQAGFRVNRVFQDANGQFAVLELILA